MVMSCSSERTSVAARPCWDLGCHANPTPTHTCTRSLPLSYIRLPPFTCSQTHTNTHLQRGAVLLACTLSCCSSVLLYTFSICAVAWKWLSAAKIMNSLEHTHLLSFSSVLSLGFFRFFFLYPPFLLLYNFLLWYLLVPIILSSAFTEIMHWWMWLKTVFVCFHCADFLVLYQFVSLYLWLPIVWH